MSPWFHALPLALALAGGPALAQQATITVTGQGTTTGAPDLMIVDLGVQVVRATSREALADAADRANTLLRALRRAGVDEDDIQTSQLAVHPVYDYRGEVRSLRGYQATNTVTARVRDLDRAGRTIDAAVAAADDEAVVQGVRFDIERDEALVRAAREAAWQDARSDARHLARLASVRLGDPVRIQEQAAPSVVPIAYAREAMDASTPIAPGELQVTVTIDVAFAIEPPEGT